MHINSGNCLECAAILNKYPGFSEELRTWFFALQIENPDLHTSCGGRGHVDQEAAFAKGASKAHWLESSHNWNLACDLFQLKDGVYTLDQVWFNSVVGSNLYPSLNWYGIKGSPYRELPHVEIRGWRSLVASGDAVPVE